MDFNVPSTTQGHLRTTKALYVSLRQQKNVRLVKSGNEKAEVDTEVEEHVNYTRENKNNYNFTNTAAKCHKQGSSFVFVLIQSKAVTIILTCVFFRT